MKLMGFKHKTYHAWGESKEHTTIVEFDKEAYNSQPEFLEDLIEGIHNKYSFSDKYRGCDGELLPLEEIPIDILKEELEYKLLNLEHDKDVCKILTDVINNV